MALEIPTKVITEYRANVDQHTGELRKLDKARKENELTERGVSAAIEKSLTKIHAQIVGLTAGYATLTSAVSMAKHAIEVSRLETGAAGVDMDGLRRASAGLKTDTDLLRDAVKFKAAAFKLDQKSMEDAEGAMRALIRKGHDATKVNNAITQSLTKLSTEGLQELGVHVKKAGLSMDDARDRAELFKRILAELRGESKGVSDALLTKEERLAQSGVAFENSVEKIKHALSGLVIAMAPLVEKVAWFLQKIPQLMTFMQKQSTRGLGIAAQGINEALEFGGLDIRLPEIVDTEAPTGIDWPAFIAGQQLQQRRIAELIAKGQGIEAMRIGVLGKPEGTMGVDLAELLTTTFGPLVDDWAAALGRKESARFAGRETREKAAAAAQKAADEARKAFEMRFMERAEREVEMADFETLDEAIERVNREEKFEAGIKLRDELMKAVPATFKEEGQTIYEQMFGKPEEIREIFDAQKIAFESLGKAATLMGKAIGEAYGAWIDGSKSASAAFKQFVAETLKSTAMQLVATAIQQGVEAIVWLATGNLPRAALHGKAAATAAAGAVIVGGLAKAAYSGGWGGAGSGGGGAGAGAGAGGAAPGGGGGGRPEGGGDHRVYVIGDPYGDRTPRERARDFRRQARRAIGSDWGGEF